MFVFVAKLMFWSSSFVYLADILAVNSPDEFFFLHGVIKRSEWKKAQANLTVIVIKAIRKVFLHKIDHENKTKIEYN